jgi:hypothetical protein
MRYDKLGRPPFHEKSVSVGVKKNLECNVTHHHNLHRSKWRYPSTNSDGSNTVVNDTGNENNFFHSSLRLILALALGWQHHGRERDSGSTRTRMVQILMWKTEKNISNLEV